MASTKLSGYEETVICPYNKCHVILRHRFQTHLVKCARNYPDTKLDICPFDVTHRFREEDRKIHIEECPSRGNFDRYVYSVATTDTPPARDLPPRQTSKQDDADEESWDHYNTPTYNPQKYAMNAQVLRNPVLMIPSERKKFADAERKRLSNLGRGDQ